MMYSRAYSFDGSRISASVDVTPTYTHAYFSPVSTRITIVMIAHTTSSDKSATVNPPIYKNTMHSAANIPHSVSFFVISLLFIIHLSSTE